MRWGIIGLGLLLAACQTTAPTPATTTAAAPLSDQEAFKRARARLVDGLKDPDSAKIDPNMVRKASGMTFSGPVDIVCGRVNGKNAYGAYTGMKRFVYKIADDQIILDGEDPDPLYRNAATLWCGA